MSGTACNDSLSGVFIVLNLDWLNAAINRQGAVRPSHQKREGRRRVPVKYLQVAVGRVKRCHRGHRNGQQRRRRRQPLSR